MGRTPLSIALPLLILLTLVMPIGISDIQGFLSEESSFKTKLIAGRHNITLTVDDGQAGIDTASVFLIINTPPRVTVWAEESQADENLLIQWNIDDPEGGQLDITLYAMGTGEPTLIADHLEDIGSYLWDTGDLPEGTLSIRMEVFDGWDTAHGEFGTIEVYHQNLHPDYYILDQRINIIDEIGDYRENDEIRLTFTVVNPLDIQSLEFTVFYYLDDPEGIPIHMEKITLLANEKRQIEYTWTAVKGDHIIYAKIDPNDEVQDNNMAYLSLSIKSAKGNGNDDDFSIVTDNLLFIMITVAVIVVTLGFVTKLHRDKEDEDDWGMVPTPDTQPGQPIQQAAQTQPVQSTTQPLTQAAPFAPAVPLTSAAPVLSAVVNCPYCLQPAPFLAEYGYYYCAACRQFLTLENPVQ